MWLVLMMLHVQLVQLVLLLPPVLLVLVLVLPGSVPLFAPLTTVDKILPVLELALSLAPLGELPLVRLMAPVFSAPAAE